jgi:hypothetical protein
MAVCWLSARTCNLVLVSPLLTLACVNPNEARDLLFPCLPLATALLKKEISNGAEWRKCPGGKKIGTRRTRLVVYGVRQPRAAAFEAAHNPW